MISLLWLIPITLALGGAALAVFVWSVRSGQFEDLDAAAHRILDDDVTRRGAGPPGPSAR
ncbi:cbb3-type cytochrome oxidase assembly protein CcoS [Muricoccus radiodurans]|uniref:cbb3-type cytochrome oxidase assembly protein CcoS n=1 Tax=Muricoccus radiodurans TaxID=2231721 RepID=UPI003CEEA1D5